MLTYACVTVLSRCAETLPCSAGGIAVLHVHSSMIRCTISYISSCYILAARIYAFSAVLLACLICKSIFLISFRVSSGLASEWLRLISLCIFGAWRVVGMWRILGCGGFGVRIHFRPGVFVVLTFVNLLVLPNSHSCTTFLLGVACCVRSYRLGAWNRALIKRT